jgi:hypothetical protein
MFKECMPALLTSLLDLIPLEKYISKSNETPRRTMSSLANCKIKSGMAIKCIILPNIRKSLANIILENTHEIVIVHEQTINLCRTTRTD